MFRFILSSNELSCIIETLQVANRYNLQYKLLLSTLLLQITVLACISGDGSFEKPLVTFPGVRTPRYPINTVNPAEYSLGHSSNGWMTADVFFTWLSSVFFPAIKDQVEFPIIIFLHGYTSHINLAVADF